MKESKIPLKGGNNLTIKFHRTAPFDLGISYICDNNVVYHFHGSSCWDDVERMGVVNYFQYGSDDLRDTVSPVLPRKFEILRDTGDRPIVRVVKQPDCYPLNVVEASIGQDEFDTCLMWSVSRMLKMCCVLKLASVSYGGFSPENVFVWASGHTIFLPGGWWKSNLSPTWEDIAGDIKDVKKLAGSYFSGGAYKYVLEWCREEPADDPFEELRRWDVAVDESVGTRRFVPLVIDHDSAY